MRVSERIRQEESEDEAANDSEAAHESEQPEPAGLATDTTHVEDTEGKQLCRRLAELIAKVKDHDTLGGLVSRVPGGERPEATRDKPRLSYAQDKAGGNESAVPVLEGLECADDAEEEELQGKPLARSNTVENHVGGDFSQNNAERQHLLADIELILINAHIFHELVRDGIGHVSSVQLW